MDNTINPMFAKFDTALGATTPTPATPQPPKWSDQIRALAKPSTPTQDTTSKPSIVGTLTKPAVEGVEGLKTLYGGGEQGIANKLSQDVQAGASDIQKGDVLKGIAKSGLRTAGDVAGAVYAPVGAAIGATGVGKVLDWAGKGISNISHIADIPAVQEFAMKHPNAGEDFGRVMNIIMGGLDKGKIEPSTTIERTAEQAKAIPEQIKTGTENIKNVASNVKTGIEQVSKPVIEGTKKVAGNIKEEIAPTLNPEEATRQIVQGETTDVKHALPTIKGLTDTSKIKTYSDLSKAIDEQIIKPNLKEVNEAFSKDTSGGHSIKSFEQTIGKGNSAVKVNYVKDAISQLKDFYKETGDAKGLSDMKVLENKAKINGLTYKDINNLAKEHGFTIKAFNANGEASSGLSKQAAENTRSGLKTTARKGLGTKKAQALDEKASQAIKTKSLIDDMVEKVSSANQKNIKQGVIPKAIGKIIETADTLTGNPIKAIGKRMGNVGGSMSPIEIEAQLAKNLKHIRGK
jgi:hypothetical protein